MNSAPLTHVDDARDGLTRTPSAGRIAVLLVLVATLALVLAERERVADLGSTFLDAYVSAQQAMLEAAGNTTPDGQSEFAVLLSEGTSVDMFRRTLEPIADVRFAREADLDGWVIIHTAAGNRAGLDAVFALPEARLVMPNRGLWICH